MEQRAGAWRVHSPVALPPEKRHSAWRRYVGRVPASVAVETPHGHAFYVPVAELVDAPASKAVHLWVQLPPGTPFLRGHRKRERYGKNRSSGEAGWRRKS